MKKISIEKVKPKDIVAKDVVRDNGTLLVKAGTELSEDLIERLKKLKVSHVYIQVASGVEEYQRKIKFFKDRLDRLDYLFRKHEKDEFMLKMKIFFKNYFKNRILILLKEIKEQENSLEQKEKIEDQKSNGRPNN